MEQNKPKTKIEVFTVPGTPKYSNCHVVYQSKPEKSDTDVCTEAVFHNWLPEKSGHPEGVELDSSKSETILLMSKKYRIFALAWNRTGKSEYFGKKIIKKYALNKAVSEKEMNDSKIILLDSAGRFHSPADNSLIPSTIVFFLDGHSREQIRVYEYLADIKKLPAMQDRLETYWEYDDEVFCDNDSKIPNSSMMVFIYPSAEENNEYIQKWKNRPYEKLFLLKLIPDLALKYLFFHAFPELQKYYPKLMTEGSEEK